MTCAFIDDGYTEKQLIREVKGLHPSAWVTFRPMTTTEIAEWSNELEHKNAIDVKKVSARWLNDHIVNWDLGKEANLENLLKLKPALYDRIFSMVWGYSPGDEMEKDLKNSQEG